MVELENTKYLKHIYLLIIQIHFMEQHQPRSPARHVMQSFLALAWMQGCDLRLIATIVIRLNLPGVNSVAEAITNEVEGQDSEKDG